MEMMIVKLLVAMAQIHLTILRLGWGFLLGGWYTDYLGFAALKYCARIAKDSHFPFLR